MDIALKALVLIVSLSAVGLHGWAGKGHFASTYLPPGAALLMLAVGISICSLSLLLITGSPPLAALVAGLVVELASLALFRAAILASRAAHLLLAFDKNLPHTLLRSGPYARIRHPFYASYILFWAGVCIATWHPLAIPIFGLMLGFYLTAARGEEQKFARTRFAADYAAYRLQAGMFWPKRQ